MSTAPVETEGHLPSLDGLRAISVVLVVIGHLTGTRNFPSLPGIHLLGDIAHLGVTVFFVISGFLITSLLMKEYARNGYVSLKLFYARRALRILPASLALIGVAATLSAAGFITLHRYDLVTALTYTINFHPERSWWLGHLWSLAVEEQFYLLWPFAFAMLGGRRSLTVALLAIAMGPMARAASWYFLRGTIWRDAPMFPMVADSLAIGCVLALQRRWFEQQSWYVGLFRPQWSLLLIGILFLFNRMHRYSVVSIVGTTLINVCLAILIHRSMVRANDLFGRCLNWKPVVFVGVFSYSLYVWQQLFLNRASGAWVNAFPQNLFFAIAAGLASYLLLEKPLMSFRQRLRLHSAAGERETVAAS